MRELITLITRAMQGDGTAFAHLVTQHWRFVYTICLSQVGRAAEAEDLTQEVFVRVSHDLADLREPEKFLRWLRQVATEVRDMAQGQCGCQCGCGGAKQKGTGKGEGS
ncbi:MAG: sigma-70 family RNA polymerase sigma factor [Nitrospinae bacterium]|nr:sigma-70 family RNA polymerase sigma factor [Nitrospinota bacterium]